MSWTVYKTADNDSNIKDLNRIINKAGEDGIILYCACEDKGQNKVGKSYPGSSDTKKLKRIGACDEFSQRAGYVNAEVGSFDYLFPGEIVTTNGEVTSGSSAATAFASGLAALILWCAE